MLSSPGLSKVSLRADADPVSSRWQAGFELSPSSVNVLKQSSKFSVAGTTQGFLVGRLESGLKEWVEFGGRDMGTPSFEQRPPRAPPAQALPLPNSTVLGTEKLSAFLMIEKSQARRLWTPGSQAS